MTASCEQLVPFALGQLPPRERYRMQVHVASCSTCAEGLEVIWQAQAGEWRAQAQRRTVVLALLLLLAAGLVAIFLAADVGGRLFGVRDSTPRPARAAVADVGDRSLGGRQ